MQSLSNFLTDPVTQLRRKMNLIHEEISKISKKIQVKIFEK